MQAQICLPVWKGNTLFRSPRQYSISLGSHFPQNLLSVSFLVQVIARMLPHMRNAIDLSPNHRSLLHRIQVHLKFSLLLLFQNYTCT